MVGIAQLGSGSQMPPRPTVIYPCTLDGKPTRQHSLMEAIILINVQCLETEHLVVVGVFSLASSAGSQSTSRRLVTSFIMLMMPSLLHSLMTSHSTDHTTASCRPHRLSSLNSLMRSVYCMKMQSNSMVLC